MSEEGVLRWDEFELDVRAWELRRLGRRVRIQRKPLELLAHLARHRSRIVSKEELLDSLWPDLEVSEQALASALRDVRRALGDTDTAHRTVLTVRRVGYRFVGRIAESAPGRAGTAARAGDAEPVAADRELTFVDREDVMGQLLDSLRAACAGGTRLSFIAGPPGIGKTRAALELMRAAGAQGVETQFARCYDGDGAPPFWPWIQIVRGTVAQRGALQVSERTGSARRSLAWIVPELAGPGEVEGHADLEGAEARFRLFDAMAQFFRELSRDRPLLLVLDDIQWADEASLLLLEFMAQTRKDERLHVVTTLRSAEVAQRQTLARVLGTSARAGADRIELRGLCRESVSRLLAAASGRGPSVEFTDAVLSATGGNPFFVSEIVKQTTTGELDVTAVSALPIPTGARDAIRQQLRRVSAECVRALKLASVIGREFDIATLAESLAVPAACALERLAEAERLGLVQPIADKVGVLGFVHDLVREALYLELDMIERVSAHRVVAEAIERLSARDPNARLRELAMHYSEAAVGAPDALAAKAGAYCRAAGQAANQVMAFEDAVAQFGRAHAALLLVPSTPAERCELLLAQAEAAWGTSAPAASVHQRFEDAAQLARSAKHGALLARAALGRTGHGAGTGDFRDIAVIDATDIELLSEAMRQLTDADSELQALVLSRLAVAVRYERGFAEADALSRRAQGLAEACGRTATLASVLRYRHEVVSGPSHVVERLELAERLLALARAENLRPLEIDALYFLARGQLELANLALAASFAAQAHALSASMRHPGASYRAGISAVLGLTLRGSFAEAERSAAEYYARDGIRNLGASKTYNGQLAKLKSLQGEHVRTIELIEETLGQHTMLQWCRSWIALERALAGDHAPALAFLERLAASGFRTVSDDHCRLGELMNLADMVDETGSAQHAGALYEQLRPHADLVSAPLLAMLCDGAAARGVGTVLGLLGRFDEAEALFEKAARIEMSMSSQPLVALTLERHGRMLCRMPGAGARERGRSLLARARTIGENLGMRGLCQRCSRVAGS